MAPWTLWDEPLEHLLWTWWQLTDAERADGLLAESVALRDARYVAEATWGKRGLADATADWLARLNARPAEPLEQSVDRARRLVERAERAGVMRDG